MRRISRREFMRGLVGLGLGALGAGTLLSRLPWGERLAALADLVPEDSMAPQAALAASPHVREAMYYAGIEENLRCQSCHTGVQEPARVLYCHRTESHTGSHVKCQLCPKGCVISEGHRGDCRVRENRGGKLHTMVYGNPCAVHIDPIEKKPFFHFNPGTPAFSIATAGCNLHCLYCQNWTISQVPPEETDNYDLPPEDVVALALDKGCPSIAYTYAEPTVFYEYMLTTARLGRAKGVRSVVISAGYMNPGPLRDLCRAVDAIKIDLKGFNKEFYKKVCFATLEPVLESIKTVHEEGVHLEIVNLVVPTLNDDPDELRDMARWIMDNVGPDVPLHFSRFYPQYKLKNLPPTPVESLERAREVALDAGIHYVYIGNVPGHPGNQTYCARCGKIIIRRLGFAVMEYHIADGQCEFCGQPIPGVWELGGITRGFGG
ncbi:MAG: AmmeMemoRadiSam system radical SAM enzyme, partial [Anaerolineae bacterium]